MAKKKRALVVPHTHWDRDWYWSLERFRVRLIDMFKTMLDLFEKYDDYRFTMDGQSIPIEDYLELHPEDAPVLKRLGSEGRLKAGPMYVLSDLYCTGGEALIRNLLIGMEMAEEKASVQKHTLHMPDTFGITPCIPMIAEGFGFKTFTFMRGSNGAVPSELRMFLWKTPDGSAVRVFRLRDGYANAARLGFDPKEKSEKRTYKEHLAARNLQKAARRQDDQQGGPRLLLAGVDHQIPQDLAGAMERASTRGPFEFTFSDLDALSEGVLAKDTSDWLEYQGEFHGTGAASVLGGTISARPYLKQKNAEVERMLCVGAERSDALVLLSGYDDPAHASIRVGWKHLLKTHPHDDICGCSVDPVHRDNEYNMRQAADVANAVEHRMVERLVKHFGGNAKGDERYAFFLFNTQPCACSKTMRLKIDFEGKKKFGDFPPPDHFAVVDEEGNVVPFRLVSKGRTSEHPHQQILIDLDATLAPMSMNRFYIEERSTWPAPKPDNTRMLENDFLVAHIKTNGTVDVSCKATGVTWSNLGVFSNQADIGDTYDFADNPDETEACFENLRFKASTEGAAGMKIVVLTGSLKIPESSEEDKRASKKSTVPMHIEYSLGRNARQIDVRLRFVNTAADHRLRWNMPLDFRPRTTRAGLKFNEVERPAGKQPRRKTGLRVHPIHPMDHFVAVEQKEGGLAVFSEFPMNYELVSTQESRLALTLLRAVGQLSRSQHTVRGPNGAGPETPTPEAQCLGREFDYRFALRPFAPDEGPLMMKEAMLWRERPVFGLVTEPRHDCAPRKKRGADPVLMEADGDAPVLTALKRKQSGSGVVFRFFNPLSETKCYRVRVRGVARLIPLGLNEAERGAASLDCYEDGWFDLEIPAFGLATYEIQEDAPWASL